MPELKNQAPVWLLTQLTLAPSRAEPSARHGRRNATRVGFATSSLDVLDKRSFVCGGPDYRGNRHIE
jgi:hypothetical protein